MNKNINIVYMNEEILNIIHLVLDYSRFIKSENLVKKEKNFDWYEKTKKYYFDLELPLGMKHNNCDFEKIFSYSNMKNLLEEMDNTEEYNLSKYEWTNNYSKNKKINKNLIKLIKKEHLLYDSGSYENDTFAFYMKLPKEIVDIYSYLLPNSDGTISDKICIENLFVEYRIDKNEFYYFFTFEDDCVVFNDEFNCPYLNNLVYAKYERFLEL